MSGAAPRASPPAIGNSKFHSHSRSGRPMPRSTRPGASGPSGVSCIGSIAAASTSGETSTGERTSCSAMCAVNSAVRSGANGSTCSRTPWTRLPNSRPPGSSAIGEGTSAPGDVEKSTGMSPDSSSCPVSSGSDSTVTTCVSRINAEYEVRCHDVSTERSKCLADKSSGTKGLGSAGVSTATDALDDRAPGLLPRPETRHRPASSVTSVARVGNVGRRRDCDSAAAATARRRPRPTRRPPRDDLRLRAGQRDIASAGCCLCGSCR